MIEKQNYDSLVNLFVTMMLNRINYNIQLYISIKTKQALKLKYIFIVIVLLIDDTLN